MVMYLYRVQSRLNVDSRWQDETKLGPSGEPVAWTAESAAAWCRKMPERPGMQAQVLRRAELGRWRVHRRFAVDADGRVSRSGR